METLYVLQLANGKYYVGKSADVGKRFEQHKSGSGSGWTSLHKPIRIMETRPITSSHDETNVTKDLMKKYGVSNVRGGAYTAVDLPEEQEDMIRHEMRSASDACYKCGKHGHFASQCKRKSSFAGRCACGREFLEFDEFLSHNRACVGRAVEAKKKASPKQKTTAVGTGACYRCGRTSHYSPDCYASTHVKGYELD